MTLSPFVKRLRNVDLLMWNQKCSDLSKTEKTEFYNIFHILPSRD